ncbi:MAG: hypothetical protein L0387_17825 [Acidobacteria bacterium]|nr:hypothetical protein [Acidobacteriota bacterium]MCI0719539.1 hypothetical protein [Acidobacteriota bacterium]
MANPTLFVQKCRHLFVRRRLFSIARRATLSAPGRRKRLAGYVRYNENVVLVSARSESPKRQRGPVAITLAGASGFQGHCHGDIKGEALG